MYVSRNFPIYVLNRKNKRIFDQEIKKAICEGHYDKAELLREIKARQTKDPEQKLINIWNDTLLRIEDYKNKSHVLRSKERPFSYNRVLLEGKKIYNAKSINASIRFKDFCRLLLEELDATEAEHNSHWYSKDTYSTLAAHYIKIFELNSIDPLSDELKAENFPENNLDKYNVIAPLVKPIISTADILSTLPKSVEEPLLETTNTKNDDEIKIEITVENSSPPPEKETTLVIEKTKTDPKETPKMVEKDKNAALSKSISLERNNITQNQFANEEDKKQKEIEKKKPSKIHHLFGKKHHKKENPIKPLTHTVPIKTFQQSH